MCDQEVYHGRVFNAGGNTVPHRQFDSSKFRRRMTMVWIFLIACGAAVAYLGYKMILTLQKVPS